MLHFLNQVKTYELTEIQREKTVNVCNNNNLNYLFTEIPSSIINRE